MLKNLSVSIGVGLTGAIWAFIADKIGIAPWPAFVGWSLFFLTGADFKACKKSFPGIVLGAVLAFLAVKVQLTLGTVGIASAIVVFFLSFTMTYAQGISIFSVAPATFLGGAMFFGTGNLLDAIVITSIGLILGIVSIAITRVFDKILLKSEQKEVYEN